MESKKINIVSFSGGKDSTAMLLLMIENNYPIDDIIFFDTGWEFDEIYQHIYKLEKYINREITKIYPEKSFDYWFSEHIKTKGKRKGEQGYGWPDFMNRWCTRIKIDSIKKYYKKQNYNENNSIEYIGIAKNEKKRLNKFKNVFNREHPLVDFNFDEEQTLKYCYKKGFDWNGLYQKVCRVSCFCCPLQSMRDLRAIYTYKPNLWNKMIEMDKKSKRDFKSNYTLDELTKKFEKGK